MKNVQAIYGDKLFYSPGVMNTIDGADALVICTEWSEFRNPSFTDLKKRLAKPVIFDGRNLFDPHVMAEQKFTYYSIGRVPVGV